MQIIVEDPAEMPVSKLRVEMVERKGLGHPDTICDHLAEAMSQGLCRAYLEATGRVLHYNVENAFLVAGSTTPTLGGGTVELPMRFIYGDSATTEFEGRRIDVRAVTEDAARAWIRDHLPLVDRDRHILFESELRPGSLQLADIFARERLGSNDTCFGSGYAPLSETEEIVLAVEHEINSPAFKARFPATGQDVKVTATRVDRELSLTLSLAFVDAWIESEAAYFDHKAEVGDVIERFAAGLVRDIGRVDVAINTLDQPGRGASGIYLTVLGTSAEGADGGQIGRGNRPVGVNATRRPLATGGVAGKNPVSNVGKIYSLFAGDLARSIHGTVGGLAEVYVTLASRIGDPVGDPHLVTIRIVPEVDDRHPARSGADPDVRDAVERAAARGIEAMPAFVERLVTDPPPVC